MADLFINQSTSSGIDQKQCIADMFKWLGVDNKTKVCI